MKRAMWFGVLLLSAAGYVYLQTNPPAPKLAGLMPSGAVLYLEAPDFGALLRDWDSSAVKAEWLNSGNYAAFSRSTLFSKLGDVYGQYGEAAGFLPGLKGAIEIAGTDSALALYDIRGVEFLYVSRIADGDLMKSQLWTVREKFEQRQAGGVAFYLRTDPASKATVAFAFTKGYLLLGTRDDLIAQSLELLAGGSNPSVASDRWYQDSTAAASNAGDVRLVMNLEALVKSTYFRSYWVQRNASAIRPYWAGVADVKRSSGNITESRVFLRTPDAVEASAAATSAGGVSSLLALVPRNAGLYKAWRIGDGGETSAIIIQKLVGTQTRSEGDWRYAPSAIAMESSTGSEGDLETRIDEQPLPADAGLKESTAAVRAMVEKGGARACLLVQSSEPVAGTFVRMPSVMVLEGAQDWDGSTVRNSLAAAAGKLWTTSQLGAGWIGGTAGGQAFERLDGLGTLALAIRGRLLFLSNDIPLMTAVLSGTAGASGGAVSYAAGFRHSVERANFGRVMRALDFGQSERFRYREGPGFFSDNLGSLSQVLARVAEVRMTEEQQRGATVQTVVYQMAQ